MQVQQPVDGLEAVHNLHIRYIYIHIYVTQSTKISNDSELALMCDITVKFCKLDNIGRWHFVGVKGQRLTIFRFLQKFINQTVFSNHQDCIEHKKNTFYNPIFSLITTTYHKIKKTFFHIFYINKKHFTAFWKINFLDHIVILEHFKIQKHIF